MTDTSHRNRRQECSRRLVAVGSAVVVAAALSGGMSAAANDAKGTVTYKGKSGAPIVVTLKHAYLFKGPDVVSGKTIRRVVLSVADVEAALRACASMMCSDGDIREGMTVDLDAGPKLNYWFVANDQRVQYSGIADPGSLKLTADTPQRVAGVWELDAHAAGGPVAHVEFDAALIKELKAGRQAR